MRYMPFKRLALMAYFTADLNYVLFMRRFPDPNPAPEQMPYFWGGVPANWVAWQVPSLLGIFAGPTHMPVQWGMGFAGTLALLGMAYSLLADRATWRGRRWWRAARPWRPMPAAEAEHRGGDLPPPWPWAPHRPCAAPAQAVDDRGDGHWEDRARHRRPGADIVGTRGFFFLPGAKCRCPHGCARACATRRWPPWRRWWCPRW
jgi:hypothetical protein